MRAEPEPEAAAKSGARKGAAAKRRRFLIVLKETGNVSLAARAAGLSTSTVYRRRQRSPEFATAWNMAMTEAMDTLEAALLARARDGVERPVFYAGKRIDTVRSYSDALGMFMLRARRPEIYDRPREGQEGALITSDDAAHAAVMAKLDRLTADDGRDDVLRSGQGDMPDATEEAR